MDQNHEPPQKKIKTIDDADLCKDIDEYIEKVENSTNNLIPIISKEFTERIATIQVYVAVITNPKDISRIIAVLNERIPLKDLQHLKRVRKKEIIVTDDLEGSNIKDFVESKLNDVIEAFEHYKIENVPAKQPKLKWQFDECNKIWPCNFHPNKYHEKLLSGSFFEEAELAIHKLFMKVVLEVIKMDLVDNTTRRLGATVVVDPTTKSIVAINTDNRDRHPIQHAAMLAIDNVAKTQNGGYWNGGKLCNGYEKALKVKLEQKFPDLIFGAKEYRPKGENGTCDSSGPYLCTGYSVYTFNEPCIMCSMALVHARAKRVFFCKDNENDGGMKSKAKLQTVASLNHHFEVFTGFV